MPRQTQQPRRDYKPLPWSNYFDEAIDVQTNSTDSFRVYLSSFSKDELNAGDRPTLILLHGGGYSGLTWSLFTTHIKEYCHCRIMAIDQRGHGYTSTSNDNELSIDNLVEDVANVANKVHEMYGFEMLPPQVIIGHSMGGAVAVKCASRCEDILRSLIGFVVIDVVEGTAIDALQGMQSVLNSRPTKFHSLTNAIEWSIRSGMTKNPEAARVSMPGNLVNSENRLAIYDVDKIIASEEPESFDEQPNQEFYMAPDKQQLAKRILNCPSLPPSRGTLPHPSIMSGRNIVEEDEEEHEEKDLERTIKSEHQLSGDNEHSFKRPERQLTSTSTTGYTWRTNLMSTQPFWKGWFEGLSSQLLSAPVQGKLLLLAGIDRLDKELTIGQMQGKFMMRVLPKCGHAVHEDVPQQVADVVGNFLVRNKFAKSIC